MAGIDRAALVPWDGPGEGTMADMDLAGVLRNFLSELVATFILVVTGCGAVAVESLHAGSIGSLGICIVFGLVVTAMVYATGHVSGAHINPAVTIAFASAGHFSWKQVPVYIVAQCLGAIAACALLSGMLGPEAALGVTAPSGSVMQALVMEIVVTFVLMFSIAGVATDGRAHGVLAGASIGGTVALCALFGGPISGASMNPARSLGPALVAGEWTAFWIYIVGPLIGALAGMWAYEAIKGSETPA